MPLPLGYSPGTLSVSAIETLNWSRLPLESVYMCTAIGTRPFPVRE